MPKIEVVDFFYLSMPEVLDIGDGSQDALLVRAAAGGQVGWGECEASPLVSIAAWNCPMSHSACKPVSASVLGQSIDSPDDIRRIHRQVRENSLDLLQADHTLSGVDVALWDLLGKLRDEPVYRLLGYEGSGKGSRAGGGSGAGSGTDQVNRAYPKIPYASLLFGDTAQETLDKARKVRQDGYQAAKFGWGPFGRGRLKADVEQVRAAREGLGEDAILCIDAGTVWGENLAAAQARLGVLQECQVTWLEEPFYNGALPAYLELAKACKRINKSHRVRLAGGEGAHNEFQAQHMIDYGGVGFIQIDAGRVGGLTSAKRVADYAADRGVTYVNHTFTSHLALSASLQPYAGLEDHQLCEYPLELKPLAWELTLEHLTPDTNGEIALPERPGLGITPDLQAVKKYLVETEITVQGKVLYRTPEV